MPQAQCRRNGGPKSSSDCASLGRFVVAFCALWLGIVLGPAGAVLAADQASIFRPAPVPAQHTNWAQTLSSTGLSEPDRRQLSGLLTAAEQHPSMGTALAVMAQTPLISQTVREKIIAANRLVLPMADLARHQMTIDTNIALNGGAANKIAAVSRVGSSAKRHKQWLAWNGDWAHLPFDSDTDDSYFRREVGSSDDDLTVWATKEDQAKSPAAHELLNGKFAEDRFNSLVEEHIKAAQQAVPRPLREFLEAVDTRNASRNMKVGYLSPTQSWLRVLPPVARKDFSFAPNDLLALLKSDADKYNGLFFEEQIHQWGRDKGVVTESVANPVGTTVTYEQSLGMGKLATLAGPFTTDGRRLDPLGWVSNNYRQSFLTQKGKLREVAKYTGRILAYWEYTTLDLEKAIEETRDVPGLGRETMVEDTKRLVKAIYNPESVEALESAIAGAGGEIEVSKRLKGFQMRLLVAANRRHVQVIEDELNKLIRSKQIDTTNGLTFDQLKAIAGEDPGYFGFDKSLDALAIGYTNLPPDALAVVSDDMARFIAKRLESPEPGDVIGVSHRAALVGVLTESIEEAQKAAQLVERRRPKPSLKCRPFPRISSAVRSASTLPKCRLRISMSTCLTSSPERPARSGSWLTADPQELSRQSTSATPSCARSMPIGQPRTWPPIWRGSKSWASSSAGRTSPMRRTYTIISTTGRRSRWASFGSSERFTIRPGAARGMSNIRMTVSAAA